MQIGSGSFPALTHNILTEKMALGAGQLKQIHVPTGKTLEETIAIWKDVRTEALSTIEPTTAEYQLAAKATANIQRAQSQLGLDQQAATEVNAAVNEEVQGAFAQRSMAFPTIIEQTVFKQEQKYKQAMSAYSFQAQLKMNGFKIATPSFFRIA